MLHFRFEIEFKVFEVSCRETENIFQVPKALEIRPFFVLRKTSSGKYDFLLIMLLSGTQI